MIITHLQPSSKSKNLFNSHIIKVLLEIERFSTMVIDHRELQKTLLKFKKLINIMEEQSAKHPKNFNLMQTIGDCLTAYDALSKLKHTLKVLPHPHDLIQIELDKLKAEMLTESKFDNIRTKEPKFEDIKAGQTWRMKIKDRVYRTIVIFKTDANFVYPKTVKRSDKAICRLKKISIDHFLENYKLC